MKSNEEIPTYCADAYIKKVLSEYAQTVEPSDWKGIFIILKSYQQGATILRIGYPIVKMPIEDAVKLLSLNASLRLSKSYNSINLKELIIELFILHEFRKIINVKPTSYPRLININKNGVLISRNFYYGVSLPYDSNNNIDPIDLLSDCCLNAGLPPDAWLDIDTDVYIFDVTNFKEQKPEGDVYKK